MFYERALRPQVFTIEQGCAKTDTLARARTRDWEQDTVARIGSAALPNHVVDNLRHFLVVVGCLQL
jgi:hypothetical protein